MALMDPVSRDFMSIFDEVGLASVATGVGLLGSAQNRRRMKPSVANRLRQGEGYSDFFIASPGFSPSTSSLGLDFFSPQKPLTGTTTTLGPLRHKLAVKQESRSHVGNDEISGLLALRTSNFSVGPKIPQDTPSSIIMSQPRESYGQTTHSRDVWSAMRARPTPTVGKSVGAGVGYSRVKREPPESETGQPRKKIMRLTKAEAPVDNKKNGRSKGLRHFSLKVCEKVEQQKITTYQKVADELVKEMTNQPAGAGNGRKGVAAGSAAVRKNCDEKNVRRRVYDALNVLMAMGIISKDKKQITWLGLPNGLPENLKELRQTKQLRMDRVYRKLEILEDLLTKQVSYKRLVERNSRKITPEGNGSLKLPFVVLATSSETQIYCEMDDDRRRITVNCNNPFTVLEDQDVVQHLKLHQTTPWDLPLYLPQPVCEYYPASAIVVDGGVNPLADVHQPSDRLPTLPAQRNGILQEIGQVFGLGQLHVHKVT